MGVEVHVGYVKELVPDTQGAHPVAGQEQTPASDHHLLGCLQGGYPVVDPGLRLCFVFEG